MIFTYIQGRRRKAAFGLCALLSLLPGLSACTVVSIADDKAQRELHGEAFDASHYVHQIWGKRVLPNYSPSAVELSALLPMIAANPADAGTRYGRQAGVDSPWTFNARGKGTVTAIDRQSRAGSVTVSLQTSKGEQAIQLQAGPVLSGSAIRDGQSYLSFNDFTNQIAYAKVSTEMNREALAATAPQMAALKVGDRIQFAGAFSVSSAGDAIRMIPVNVQVLR